MADQAGMFGPLYPLMYPAGQQGPAPVPGAQAGLYGPLYFLMYPAGMGTAVPRAGASFAGLSLRMLGDEAVMRERLKKLKLIGLAGFATRRQQQEHNDRIVSAIYTVVAMEA